MNSDTSSKLNNTGHSTVVSNMNTVTNTKIGMAVGLLFSVFFVTMFPVILLRFFARKYDLYAPSNAVFLSKFKLWMSRINCFAGGVFLSTGFLEIFPEMLEGMQNTLEKNHIHVPFPLGPFITLLGFFLMLVVEESIVTARKTCCSGSKNSGEEVDSDEEMNSEVLEVNPENIAYNNEDEESQVLQSTSDEPETVHNHEHSHDNDHGHDHGLDADTLSKGNLAVTVLMIAISVHSIFEGLALGLKTDTAGASRLFLALCLHKYVIALTIGFQICRSSLSVLMTCVCAGIFSFATPTGVLLGFWVSYLEQQGDSSFSVVSVVLQAIACGTFFYVVFFEILPEEFAKQKDKWIKILSLFLGFVLVSLVMYFFGHENNHD